MDVKIKKTNRTTFTFKGPINLTEDLSNNYDVPMGVTHPMFK